MTQKKMYEAIEKLLDAADAIKVSLNKQGLKWNGKEIVNIKPKFKVGDWISQSISLDKIMNWDEIRVQAAIAAMQGMLANAALINDTRLDLNYRITIEQAAVSYANTLVEELKKKE